MLDIAAEIRDAFHNVNIQISQKELCNVAKVSPSQVRYWEKKGYIHSEQGRKNQNHRYDLPTLAKVICIRTFLEHGYTLQSAVKHEKDQRSIVHALHMFIENQIGDMRLTDGDNVEIDLGKIDGQPELRVHAVIDPNGHTKLRLIRTED